MLDAEYSDDEKVINEVARIAIVAVIAGFKTVFSTLNSEAIGSVAAGLIRAYPEELKGVATKNLARKGKNHSNDLES